METRTTYRRVETVVGGSIHVTLGMGFEEDGTEYPAMGASEGGTYVAIGRPWAAWRLRRVRSRVDRQAERAQRRHDSALAAQGGSHRRVS